MGTRSTISIKNLDNTYTQTYCHWDGYIDYNGFLLYCYYNTEEKVRKLLKNGMISSLYKSCDKPDGHSFDSPIDGYTIYYYRDRGTENWDDMKSTISNDEIDKLDTLDEKVQEAIDAL